jgi:hypothetical protein
MDGGNNLWQMAQPAIFKRRRWMKSKNKKTGKEINNNSCKVVFTVIFVFSSVINIER